MNNKKICITENMNTNKYYLSKIYQIVCNQRNKYFKRSTQQLAKYCINPFSTIFIYTLINDCCKLVK